MKINCKMQHINKQADLMIERDASHDFINCFLIIIMKMSGKFYELFVRCS